jgi:hypothetical protein
MKDMNSIMGTIGMVRAVGISAFLAIAFAMPMQEAAAQDPVGGAIVGGATGAIVGGVLGGGRGAAIGAIIGGATGAAIGAQGEPRPGWLQLLPRCLLSTAARRSVARCFA